MHLMLYAFSAIASLFVLRASGASEGGQAVPQKAWDERRVIHTSVAALARAWPVAGNATGHARAQGA